MNVLLKLLIVMAVVSILRSSQKFRTMSRELDQAALDSLQKIMRATEESGFPAELVPIMIALSTVMFMAMMAGLGNIRR
jgi:hypothetical protein